MASVKEITDYIKSGATEKSYSVIDKAGNNLGFVPTSQMKGLSSATQSGYEPIYKTTEGWSSAPEVSVSLNKQTGNIDIKAPKSYFDSASFQATYGDSSFLKTLSRAYKADPNAKLVDPDDDTKSYSIEDLVTEYDVAIKKYAQAKSDQANIRHDIRTRTGNDRLANGLTETDFMYMSATGTGVNDTDSTLMSIPTTPGINLLQRVMSSAGYNADLSQISRGQFKEIYNTNNSSREDIISLITQLATRSAELEKLANPTAEEITEYARIQALLAYISENEPEQGFWEEVGLFTEAGAKGAFSGLATAGGNLLIFAEGAGNLLNWFFSMPLRIDEEGNTSILGIKDAPGYSTMFRSDIEASRQEEQRQLEEISYINRNAAAIGMIAKLGAEIGANYFIGKTAADAITEGMTWVGNKALLRALEQGADIISQLPKDVIAPITYTEPNGLAAMTYFYSVPEVATQLLNVAKISPASFITGVNAMLKGLQYAGHAQEVVGIVNNAVKAINTVGKINPWVNLISNVVVDVAVHDADIFRDIMEYGDSKNVGDLLQTVLSDVVLIGGAAGLYWLANKFPKTNVGRQANQAISKALISADAIVENTKENLKQVVLHDANYISKIKNVSKRQAEEANELIRRAKTAVAGAEGGRATSEAIDTLVSVQNAFNEGKSNLETIQKLMVDPDASAILAPAYWNAVGAEQDLSRAITAANMPVPKAPDGASIMRNAIPSGVDKYRAAYYQKGQIENFYAVTKAYKPGMEKALASATEFMEDFEREWPQVAEAARQTIPTYVEAYSALRDYQIAHKLFSEAQLKEMNASPLYPQGYMPIRSEKEFAARQNDRIELITKASKRQLTLDTDEYTWGALAESYQNPIAILEDDMRLTAEVQEARDKLSTALDPKISQHKVVVPATDYKRVETVKALKKKAQKDIKASFKSFHENAARDALVTKAAQNFAQHSEYLRQQKATQSAGAAAKRAETKEYKVTAVDRNRYIDGLPSESVSETALKNNGYTFSDMLPVQFAEATKIAPVSKELRNSIAANSKYIGWNNVLGARPEEPVNITVFPDESYIDYYTAPNTFNDDGVMLTADYKQRLNERYPDTIDGVSLALDEKLLLADWDAGSSDISATIEILKKNKGDWGGIKDNEFLKSYKGHPRAGRAKAMTPTIQNFANKVGEHQVERSTLYRIEPILNQGYQVGQQLDLPLVSFSSSESILSPKGRFTTTKMFEKDTNHYILKTEADAIGSMDISKYSSFPAQKEVLVSDSFEVVKVEEVPTPKGMRGDKDTKTIEVTLRKTRSPIKVSYENFVAVSNFDPTLAERLDRITLKNNKDFKNSDAITKAIRDNKKNTAVGQAELLWQEEIDALGVAAGLDKRGQRQLVSDIDDLITEYIYSGALKNESVRKTLDALVANEPDQDAAREYIVLSELYDYRKNLSGELRGLLSTSIRDQIKLYNAAVPKDERIDQESLVTKLTDLIEDQLYQRRNDALHTMQDAGSDLVDEASIYAEIRDLAQQITGAKIEDNMVERVNANGETEIVQVDPIVGDLVKYSPTTTPKTWFQAFMSNKLFELSHRAFRWSTTTVNAGSFMNQAWRDCLNSYIATGTLMPLNFTEQQIVENFGERIAEDYRTNQPKLYEWIEKRAKETGKTIAETAVRREMAIGEALAESTTEMAANRLDTSRNAWDKAKSAGERVLERLEYASGGFREEYLRKSNFAAAYYDALKNNKSRATAIDWATRIARDATTDFARATVHLQAFTSTIPYLRAGVNGTKSFWRLLSLDPVGVMCRMFGGILVPLMAATLSVLNDEDTKKYYRALKEYEKENTLIYVVNGQLFQIPLPQEIGTFTSPFRHLIETLNDGNIHSYWELALNDFFNALPYDNFGAFMDIDHNVLAADPTLMQRVGLEFMAAFSTFSPTIGKTIFQLTFGVDPYTGKPIDKSYWIVDEDGNRVLMDSTESQFAKWLGNATGGSPSVISNVISGIAGKTALNLLDSLTSLAQFATSSGEEGSPFLLVERTLSEMAGKLTVAEYDRTKSQWNQQINALYAKKEALREGYVDYTEKINKATSAEQREKFIAERANYIQEFMDEVTTLATNLVEVGGQSIDSYRLAALVSLVNWYEEDNVGTNALDRAESDEQKQRNKEAAQRTIESLGITTSPNQSLLGYTYQSSDGEIKVKFYTPLEILNAQSIYYTSQSIFATEIENILKSAGITNTLRNETKDLYYATSDKAKKNAIATAWDTKIATAIAPYVAKYGVEQVITQKEVVDFLDDYLLIPSGYLQKYNSRVDVSRGYSKQFLKDIFGVK